MCTMSVVHDFYNNKFNQTGAWTTSTTPIPAADLAELRRLIAEFQEAMKAAKTVDTLMKVPDCVDPEKATLQERVAKLEKAIEALLAEKTTEGAQR